MAVTVALVPPYRGLPPRSEDLRAEVRVFLANDRDEFGWSPRVDSWISSWDPEFSRRLAARGWVGMTIPTE